MPLPVMWQHKSAFVMCSHMPELFCTGLGYSGVTDKLAEASLYLGMHHGSNVEMIG